MNKCFICGKDAVKKNSHLLPWFLIKNIVTKNGSGKRDTEMCFSVNPSNFNEMYIGRSVLPESIDENIESLKKVETNPFSRDNILCINCEKKIGRLESIFSLEIKKSRIDTVCSANSSIEKQTIIIAEEKYSYSLFQLFIQSIFIRCSIGNYGTLKLNSKVSTKIIQNLNHAFKIEKFENIQANAKVELINKFPLATIFLNNSKTHDTTKNFILANNTNNPYQLIAGNWIFQLYESKNHFLNCNEWLYGLRRKLFDILSKIIEDDVISIVVLDSEMSNKFNKTVIDDITERRQTNLRRQIRLLYRSMFNNNPTTDIVEYIEYHFYNRYNKNSNYTVCLVEAFLKLKKN